MSIFRKISDVLDIIVQSIITLFISIMTIVLFVQIIARYVFQSGTIWTDELARFLMVWMVFLGASILTKNNGHITVSVFEDFFPAAKRWLRPIQKVFIFTYAIILTKFGLDTLAIVGPQTSPNMGLSMGLVYAVLPISAIIMIIHLILQINNKSKEEERVDGP